MTTDPSYRRAGRTDGSVVIIVSPLHALMKDQIEALTTRDARAVYAGDASSDAILLDRADLILPTLQALTMDYPQGHHDYQMTSFFALEY